MFHHSPSQEKGMNAKGVRMLLDLYLPFISSQMRVLKCVISLVKLSTKNASLSPFRRDKWLWNVFEEELKNSKIKRNVDYR